MEGIGAGEQRSLAAEEKNDITIIASNETRQILAIIAIVNLAQDLHAHRF
jgi:hypothetical protein